MIDYLRLSVTDRCNLNCIYCAPLGREQFILSKEALSNTEVIKLVKVLVMAGIKKVRITGGEPLIRKDIKEILAFAEIIVIGNKSREFNHLLKHVNQNQYVLDLVGIGNKCLKKSLYEGICW